MNKLTQYLTGPFLIEEGVNDPGILKAVFLAGGPGSGKSFVAGQLYGIPNKINTSAYGMKLVNQDKALEMLLKKYGFGTDLDNMPEDLFRQLTDPSAKDYSGLRGYAKDITNQQKKLYMNGRLGLVIDGTGHRYNKIRDQKMELEKIGYDTYMVFVDTSLEVAQARNMERPRKLKPHIVEDSWKDVQKNKESFNGLFGRNFIVVNNNDTLKPEAAEKKFNMIVKKGIGSFIRKGVQNPQGKKWIEKQKIVKEDINIPVKVGDTILVGKFKNKKMKIKDIGKDKHGMPTINGRKATTFRIHKTVNIFDEEKMDRKTQLKYNKLHKKRMELIRKYGGFGPQAGSYKLKMKINDLEKQMKKLNEDINEAKVKRFWVFRKDIPKVNKLLYHYFNKDFKFDKVKKLSNGKEVGFYNVAGGYGKIMKVLDMLDKAKIHWVVPMGKESVKEEFGAPAGMLPSPSRKGINKNKTNKKSGYKEIQEFINKPKMKKALQKLIDKNVLPKSYTTNINKLQHFLTTNPMVMTQLLRLLGENINEQKQIKKVIGVFGGRFQPFHSGHFATYKWLAKQVDEAYITTSDLKMPPRHPMNYKEKVRHMTKMGIPKNRIVKEKTPYVAANLLKKYDPDTTVVVYAFGEKDAGRLKAGTKKSGGKTYYQDFKKNRKNLEGYDKHGYYLTAPQAGNVSGTQMRQLLGDPNIDDSERAKSFKQAFGYFDKGVYNMMTNKFRKLFESYELTDELIEEFLIESTNTTAGNLDDGPSTFYKDYNTYKKTSKEWLDSMYEKAGWKVIDYVLSDKAENSIKDAYRSVALTYLDHGQADGSTSAVTKYKNWMTKVVEPLGWQIVDWMGTDAAINNIIGTLFSAGADGDDYEIDWTRLTERINLDEEVALLLEGGAYGHLNHPFDDKNLTFGDFKTLIINTLQGNLSSEGAVTEKTDGQNIMVSWKNGKLLAARNKGHIKNHGAGALDINGVKNMFAGRGDIEKAFVFAMRDLQKAIGKLSDAQKTKIFDEGKKFMSLEVIYPATANVIPYDKALLQFHGTIEYDSAGSPIGEDRGSARMLAGMIKQVNQDVQKAFKIEKPFITNLPKVKDFSKKQSYFLGKLKKLQNEYKLNDTNTLADYHQAYWLEYIYNGAKQTDYKNPDNRILVKLVRRWAFFDKSYKIPKIRKDLKDYPKFLDWILTTDKMDHAKLQKQHIRDWEVLFFELGAEILSNLKDFIAANPSKSAQKIKKDLASAINRVKKSKDPKVLNTLKTQLDRLNAIGGLKSVVPSEGITFVYKGKLYKYTGAFAPANQILGMLKFV